MSDDISIWDLEPDVWDENYVAPNEVCPECKSHNIEMFQMEIYHQTHEQPAEHAFKGNCNDCGAEFEFPEEVSNDKG